MTETQQPGDRRNESIPATATGMPPSSTAVDEALEVTYREGLAIKPRSQWQLFRRRFLRHKLAMISGVVLLLICGAALFAERIAPYEYDAIDLLNRSQPPTTEDSHFFGTDKIGRDYFSRVLYGTRTSISVAF